jgi:hypothetical protein
MSPPRGPPLSPAALGGHWVTLGDGRSESGLRLHSFISRAPTQSVAVLGV